MTTSPLISKEDQDRCCCCCCCPAPDQVLDPDDARRWCTLATRRSAAELLPLSPRRLPPAAAEPGLLPVDDEEEAAQPLAFRWLVEAAVEGRCLSG